MSSEFYPRYIPPVPEEKLLRPSKRVKDDLLPPQKRLKHATNDNEIPVGSKETSATNMTKKLKKKKAQRKPSGEQEHVDEADEGMVLVHGPDLLDDMKHMKLRERFEKTVRPEIDLENGRQSQEESEDAIMDTTTEATSAAIELHGLEPIPQPAMQTEAPPSRIRHLPQWLADPVSARASSARPFKDFPLSASMVNALEKRGYTTATSIQSAVLPLLLPGPEAHNGDLCIASGTGTGKTIAFMAPMIEALSRKPASGLRGLVIVPTREAVSQTFAIGEMCAAKSGLQITTAKGGKSLKQERKLIIRRYPRWDPEAFAEQRRVSESDPLYSLDSSESDCSDRQGDFIRIAQDYVADYEFKADILICTPGRLVEHLKWGRGFNLDCIEWLVIDEMDRLMSEHYQNWAEIVIDALEFDPGLAEHKERLAKDQWTMYRKRNVRKIIASATMTTDLAKLKILRLHKPKVVIIDGSDPNVDSDDVERHDNLSGRSAFYQLPAALTEIAVPILDVAYKPVQLVQLLQPIFAKNIDSTKPEQLLESKKIAPISESSAESNDTEDTSSEDSSSSSSASGTTSSSSSGSEADSDSDADSDASSSSTFSKDHMQSPTDSTSGALIFTSTNESSLRLTRLLSILRPAWAPFIGSFTGASTSSTRRKMLAAFRNRRLQILVASNLASRSLNLADVKYVINYDMPASVEMYVHRVGRTARAGKEGTAITLVAHHEARWFWNEIGKGADVRRAGKVTRGQAEKLGREEKREYEDALAVLGDEAKGSNAGKK